MAGPLFCNLSCTEEIDWDLKYMEEDLLVVEGKITNEVKSHEVKLTLPVFEMNQTPRFVSGAVVEINDGRMVHTLREDPARPGIYRTAPDFAAEVNRFYQLRIRYRGRTVKGLTQAKPVDEFQKMRLARVQEQPPLYRATISNSNNPAIVRLELDWSHVEGYDTLPASRNHALIYHYTLNSVDVNRFFSPDQEEVLFPPGTIVFREKESVPPGYEDFLRGMLSETDWRGGIFDVLPGNAQTNMSEGAIGYFTAATVIRDTIIVE